MAEKGADVSVIKAEDGACRDERASGELRRRAELRVKEIVSEAVEDPEALPNERLRRALSELQVHQIELEMQNEELRRSQSELEASRARYFDLFDLAPVGYLSIDRSGSIMEANFAAATILGVTREAFVRKQFFDFVFRDDKDVFYKRNLRLIETGDRQSFELRMARNGASAFWTQLEMTNSMGADGQYLCRLVLTDIDARKRLEENNASLTREKEHILKERDKWRMERLVQSDKLAALGLLVAGVAHEINNPNHAIMLHAGFVERVWKSLEPVLERHFVGAEDLLVGGVEYDEARSLMGASISSLVTASAAIDHIVRGLKEFAAPDSGPLEDGVDINAVVKASSDLASGFIKKATSRFSLDLDPSVPPIKGNFQRLEQVMVNLLQNACQALTDQAQAIVLSTRFDHGTNRVVVVVSDEGCGIEETRIGQLKSPFFTTRARSGGTGLGVAISNSIIEEHGGTLAYVSSPRNGTRAIIEIPSASSGRGKAL